MREHGVAVVERQPRVAIRRGTCHLAYADHAAAACPVFNQERLSEGFREASRERAGDCIDGAAGRPGHHDPDRARGPGHLRSRHGRREHGKAKPSPRDQVPHPHRPSSR